MDARKHAEEFFNRMLDDMHGMGVWPVEFKGVVRSEAQDRDAVREIMQERTRYVAFSGDIKAGKSTLLNQLLFPDAKTTVLPTDPTPETAKITFISSIPEDFPERFEVSFYSREDWCDVKSGYQQSSHNEKFIQNIKYSESVGASESSWIGHAPITCSDFAKMAEYVSCHDPAKMDSPGVVRGKYVPYVKNVHVYCHSKWLGNDTTIVDTPGLADPNPINQNETKGWIGRAVFVFYIHSVSNSANMSRGQKEFLRDYVNGIDVQKFSIVANFFDERMEECAEGDDYSDQEVSAEAQKLVGILKKEVPWCSNDHIFPFSAKFYRKDPRLDPCGFSRNVSGILQQKVNAGEFFGRAAKVVFQSLSGHRKTLMDRKAELETRVEAMKATLEENEEELDKLNRDEKNWKNDVEELERTRIEQIRKQIISVNYDVNKIKGKVEDTIMVELDKFRYSGELAAGLKRVVVRVLRDNFAPFDGQAYDRMVDYRNAAVGDEFCRKLVGLYNAYLGKGGEPLRMCAIKKCTVDFKELESGVGPGGWDDEWRELKDKVDALFSFYRTNLENAKSGAMGILEKHVYGANDANLKSHYVKPYEDMREYVLTRVKELKEDFGKRKTILEEEIENKKQKATGGYDQASLENEISDIEGALERINEFIEERAKERDIIRLSLA